MNKVGHSCDSIATPITVSVIDINFRCKVLNISKQRSKKKINFHISTLLKYKDLLSLIL